MKKVSLSLLGLALLALLVPAQPAFAAPLNVDLEITDCVQQGPGQNLVGLRAVASGGQSCTYQYSWTNATPSSPSGDQAVSGGFDRNVTVTLTCGGELTFDTIKVDGDCD